MKCASAPPDVRQISVFQGLDSKFHSLGIRLDRTSFRSVGNRDPGWICIGPMPLDGKDDYNMRFH